MSDPGLARERTAVAWARTALGAAGFAVALIRLGVARGSVLDIVAGVLALTLSVALARAGRSAYRGSGYRRPRAILIVITIGLVVIGVLVVALALGG